MLCSLIMWKKGGVYDILQFMLVSVRLSSKLFFEKEVEGIDVMCHGSTHWVHSPHFRYIVGDCGLYPRNMVR